MTRDGIHGLSETEEGQVAHDDPGPTESEVDDWLNQEDFLPNHELIGLTPFAAELRMAIAKVCTKYGEYHPLDLCMDQTNELAGLVAALLTQTKEVPIAESQGYQSRLHQGGHDVV